MLAVMRIQSANSPSTIPTCIWKFLQIMVGLYSKPALQEPVKQTQILRDPGLPFHSLESLDILRQTHVSLQNTRNPAELLLDGRQPAAQSLRLLQLQPRGHGRLELLFRNRLPKGQGAQAAEGQEGAKGQDHGF